MLIASKRVAVIAAALLLPSALNAQVVCALGVGASSYKSAEDQRPTADAMELATRMSAAVKSICGPNCPSVAVFRNPTAANLMLVAHAAEARLTYAPQFFTAIYDEFGDGGLLGLMAHIFGHALDDTLGAAWVKSSWSPELRADAWAGCEMARADLSSDELDSAAGALRKHPAPAHPLWDARMPVLRTGFTECGGNGAKFDAAAKTR
ncbi:MAG: hypothetical protein JOZ22_15365 [Acidobacteriia bacterium]|nr:hypothetical protein [Terriglobia bacterium]